MRTIIAILVMGLLAPPVAAQSYRPDLERIRRGVQVQPQVSSSPPSRSELRAVKQPTGRVVKEKDSVWNGALIGAGLGAGSGYLWARSQCPNDTECFAIASPIGIVVGGGLGLLAGVLVDAMTR